MGSASAARRKCRARNRFSRALAEGPQRVRRHKDAVVRMSECDYEKLTGKRPSFKKFLNGAGPSLEGLDLARDHSPLREVKFESPP